MDGIASAFTPGGLVYQLAFLLLVAAILATRVDRLRALVAVASLIGFAHALAFSQDVVAAIWWALLLGAALLVLGRRAVENAKVRFTEEEEGLLRGVFSALPRSRARHLLDQGFWLSGKEGDVLTREEERVTHLYYLAAGEAKVMSHGRQVGTCRPGDLIGEVTVLSGDQASATVVLDGPARFWCAPASVLGPYIQAHEDVRRALEQGFALSLKNKLRQSNERIAGAGGVAA
jgi:CRP/FNR family cyclic AMP-dependent transcriptional regulator